jgi:hypothetical protein
MTLKEMYLKALIDGVLSADGFAFIGWGCRSHSDFNDSISNKELEVYGKRLTATSARQTPEGQEALHEYKNIPLLKAFE